MSATNSHAPNSKGLLCNAGAGAASGSWGPSLPNSIVKGSLIVGSLEQIFEREGLCGMYRGLAPTVLALLPNWAVYFTIYEHFKSRFSSSDESHHVSIGANVVATSGAELQLPLLQIHFGLSRTQGIRPGVVPYKSTLSALRKISNEEGNRGLYSDLVPALAGISHVAIQFPTYEKKFIWQNKMTQQWKSLVHVMLQLLHRSPKFLHTLTYPHEVVHSRLQEQGHHSEKRYSLRLTVLERYLRWVCHQPTKDNTSFAITFTSFETINHFLVSRFPSDPCPPIL